MTNILIDQFPETLEIEGKEYAINTDYRYALSSILAFESAELTIYEKVSIMLQNLFGNNIPENAEEALVKSQYFLNGGISEKEDREEKRVYSFDVDQSLIFAAFQGTHGIDLSTAKLHWWRFLNLFMDLGADTSFCQLVSLRKRNNEGKLTKEEKDFVRSHRDLFLLPDNEIMTLEEREKVREIEERYRKAKELRGKK